MFSARPGLSIDEHGKGNRLKLSAEDASPSLDRRREAFAGFICLLRRPIAGKVSAVELEISWRGCGLLATAPRSWRRGPSVRCTGM
jgi:hypothetical protein